jgi:hypothetical protein
VSLTDRISDKASQLAVTAVEKGADFAANGDHAGARFLALLNMKDDSPITVERLVVMLVDAVRGDESRELGERDVVKAAKKRQRRLGAVAALGGPTGLYVASLYAEVAILGDIERANRLGLSDAELAGHLMVLWHMMPDHPAAMAAIDGTGASISQRLTAQGQEKLIRGALDDGRVTKLEAVKVAWRLRGAVQDISVPGSARGRDVLLPGSRIQALKDAAEQQLGIAHVGRARVRGGWRGGRTSIVAPPENA